MRGIVVVVAFALGACDLVFELKATDGPTTPAGLRRRPIVLLPQVQEPLVDFPIHVQLAGDVDLAEHMRIDAKDVRFESGGMQLAHELIRFDQANGRFEAWVKIPMIDRPSTTFDMLYGDDLEVTANAEDVWSSNMVVGAWHLEELNVAVDSSPTGMSLRPESGDPGVVEGIAGNARSFTEGQQLCAGAADFDPDDTSFSVTLWVQVDAINGERDRPFSRGGIDDPGYNFELGDGVWAANVTDTDATRSSVTASAPLDGWVQLAAVVKRGGQAELRSYANAAEGNSADVATLGSLTSLRSTCLGHDVELFTGRIDEVRIYGKPITADAIATEYANLALRDEFMQLGDPVVVE